MKDHTYHQYTIENCFEFDLLDISSGDKVERYKYYVSEKYMFSYSDLSSKLWSANETAKKYESFNLRFNSSFSHNHPNLHLFVKVLQNVPKHIFK